MKGWRVTLTDGEVHEPMRIASCDNGGSGGLNFLFVNRETGSSIYRNESAIDSMVRVQETED